MEIRRYVSGLLSSNMYLVVEGGHAIVIDPFADVTVSEGLKIDYILLTHEHYDHISGVNLWKERVEAPVICSQDCAKNIEDPRKNLARHFRDFCELQTWIKLDHIPESDPDYSCRADESFVDQRVLSWNGHQIWMFELPGHSMGSTGILLDERYFFSGDSLMEHYDIELRLPGGSRKKWEATGRERIMNLHEGILVYPGHFREFIYQRKGGS